MRFKDQTAIVTGASKGIGWAITLGLAKEGANVAAVGRDPVRLEEIAKEIHGSGGKAIPIRADVTKVPEVQRMVQETLAAFKGIHILVNCAGGSLATSRLTVDVRKEEWDAVLNLNLKAPFLCAQAVFPFMKKQGRGRIINISSIAGRSSADLTGPQYTSAKAALQGLTRQLAREWGPYGITVNAVAPGITWDPLSKKQWESRSKEDRNTMLGAIALRRLAEAEDHVGAVRFLASPEADYVTGCTIDTSGGRVMI
jgi:3-oxoacyl-[acyl-carrier protein] reductase